MLDDLRFQQAHDGASMEAYRQKVSNDFHEFKRYNEKYRQHVIEKRRQIALLQDPNNSNRMPAQQYLF